MYLFTYLLTHSLTHFVYFIWKVLPEDLVSCEQPGELLSLLFTAVKAARIHLKLLTISSTVVLYPKILITLWTPCLQMSIIDLKKCLVQAYRLFNIIL